MSLRGRIRVMRIDREYQRSWMLWGKLLVVSLFLFLLDWGGWIGWLRRGLEMTVSPVAAVVGGIDSGKERVFCEIKFVKFGAIRLVDLERQLAEYSTSVVRVADLEKENTSLRKQVGVIDSGYEYQGGEIVSVSDGTYVVVFDGEIKFPVSAVVVYQGHLMGVVSDIGSRIVRIDGVSELLSLPVKIITASSQILGMGVVTGDVSYGVLLDDVAQEVALNTGTLVVSTGGDGVVLPDLVIGRVTEILSDPASVYKQAVVEPIVIPQVGDSVYVVVRKEER